MRQFRLEQRSLLRGSDAAVGQYSSTHSGVLNRRLLMLVE
jgi:hypothetical protein